jgi:hypothetical protein
METWLRIVGVIASLIGTLLLAWRGKRLLDALENAHYLFETNFQVLKDFMDGKQQQIPYTIGAPTFVEEFRPYSKLLFVLALFLLFAGNALVAFYWYVGSAT